MYRSLVYAQLYRSVMCYVHIIGLSEMYYVQIIGLCTAVYISDVLWTDHWFMYSCIDQ